MRPRLVLTLLAVCLLLYLEDVDDYGNRRGRAALACRENHSIDREVEFIVYLRCWGVRFQTAA